MVPNFLKIRLETVRQVQSINGIMTSSIFPALSSDVQRYLKDKIKFLQQK